MTDTPLSNSRYRNDLTAEKVRDLLIYDPETGIFRWRVDRSYRYRAGDIAGSYNREGYVRIVINRTEYRASRLAWLWMTGKWPTGEIDHANLVKDDNRWINLREATPSQNSFNSPPRAKGSALPRGVQRSRRKFMALIGNGLYLGTYDTPEEASAAYTAAAKDLYGEFYRSPNEELRTDVTEK